MSTGELLKTCVLGGGVVATVKDLTRHYFGGYYHVRILVSADVPVSAASFAAAADYEAAVVRLGQAVNFSRILEKMAVPESEIDDVRQKLMADFDANVLPYLLRDNFAPGFVRSEFRKKIKSLPTYPR
ncbi:MAG: hypothetical protein M0T70_12135 [Geobacteraceae bacterium]|nr:hypothetical protein [Geobacteraceae bacterium]